MSDPGVIALLAILHPKSRESREKTKEIFGELVSYYHEPRAQCTTWAYFTHSSRKGAPRQFVKSVAKYEGEQSIVGVELYTSKQALSKQQDEPAFKKFHEVTKREGLFAAEEELIAWYPARGFLARGDLAKPFGKGVIVNLVRFIAKEGQEANMVKVLGNYADWVRDNEPDVLTYSIMTRPKAPNEAFMFERYKDLKALAGHGGSKEFKTMFKDLSPYIERKMFSISEFEEWDESFVGNVEGGGSAAKL